MNFSDENVEVKEDEVEEINESSVVDENELDAVDEGAVEESDEASKIDYSKSVEDIIADIESVNLASVNGGESSVDAESKIKSREVKFSEGIPESNDIYRKPPARFQHNKQHTGLKNISFNVGAAVSPTDKMEFDQEEPESFGVVKINRPVGKLSPHLDNSDAVSTISSIHSEGLTDQGYFDLKFYHNKLW